MSISPMMMTRLQRDYRAESSARFRNLLQCCISAICFCITV